MIDFMVIIIIIGAAIAFSKWLQTHLAWNEHHFLYRVRCRVHDTTLIETSEYPNVNAFFCTLCSWRTEDNIVLEERDITRFSEWQRIG